MRICSRKILASALTLCLTIMSAGTVLAGDWVYGGPDDTSKWWYRETDGTWPAEEWKEIDGTWYYFNADGYMATGWKYSPRSDAWYYLDASGAMHADEIYETGYLNSDGAWFNAVGYPRSAYNITDQQRAFWGEQLVKYGLTEDISVNNGDGTYTWTLYYDDTTEIPNLYYTLLTKLVCTYNGLHAEWTMKDHTFTMTVKPREFYANDMSIILPEPAEPEVPETDPSAGTAPTESGPAAETAPSSDTTLTDPGLAADADPFTGPQASGDDSVGFDAPSA